MKITLFTSNQPRHLSLINKLAEISDVTYAIMECNTLFPGIIKDFFNKTEVMQNYFQKVIEAEQAIFDQAIFTKSNVRVLASKSADLNLFEQSKLKPALESDIYIVFGASYIKGWLIDFLVDKRAINIHMGLSPYYRGSSCNFWAMYDNRPEYVGATIHLLSKGLDSGPMLYHARPTLIEGMSAFDYTMQAVEAAQQSLVGRIASKEIYDYKPIMQDASKQLRYSRNIEFTDEVAGEFMSRKITTSRLTEMLQNNAEPELLMPFQR